MNAYYDSGLGIDFSENTNVNNDTRSEKPDFWFKNDIGTNLNMTHEIEAYEPCVRRGKSQNFT